MTNNKKISKITAPIFSYSMLNFKVDILPLLTKKLGLAYIYVKCLPIYIKDEENNLIEIKPNKWFNYEEYIRGTTIKLVIPYYRYISKEAITFHIAETLDFPISSNTVDTFWYDMGGNKKYNRYNPGIYNGKSEVFANKIRLRIQRNKPFKLNDNEILNYNNQYYFYKGKFIDLNFTFYKLNKKWLQESKIIQNCVKYKKAI